ncbi:MAG: hypothetical protein IKC46_06515 [Lachnospiraceae bacterium]|nr:hypothetical protein [Lachnospiraceae bacterium]
MTKINEEILEETVVTEAPAAEAEVVEEKKPAKRTRKTKKAEEAAEGAEAAEEKPAKRTRKTKKAEEAAEGAEAEEKPVKKPRKTAAKKKAVEAVVNVQFAGKEYTATRLVEIAKDVWMYDLGREEAEFESVELYVKTEEASVYYVINGEVTGSFAI